MHPSRPADAEIRSLIVPSPKVAATSAAAAAAAVAAAKEEASGSSPVAVAAALRLLRPQGAFKLERGDFVRGNTERGCRKRNREAASEEPSKPVAGQPSKQFKHEPAASPASQTSISAPTRTTPEAPSGQRSSTNESGTLSRRDCVDPRSFRRGCPDLYFWYRYGWPLLHW